MNNTQKQIIGIVGFIGSGKDTVADYLVNTHKFQRESFASSLKDAVSAVFNWDRTLLEGRTSESRDWRETPDTWWSNRLNMNITPRWILQHWGTEVCRIGFHDDIWIASLENKLLTSNDNIVISDCRFPNEIAMIKNAGGKIVWVTRGDLPSWYNIAVQAAEPSNDEIAIQELSRFKIHPSEWSWIGTKFDTIIDNNSTLEVLYTQANSLIVSN